MAVRFIVRLNSGHASRADHAAFADWRRQSPAHEVAAHQAEAVWGETADLHQDDASKSVRPGRDPKKPGRGTLVGLVLLMLSAGGGAGLWTMGDWKTWTADEATGVGQTRTVTLADGSRVTLNARTALDIAVTRAGRRVTFLRGEAFFEVAPDASRPFEVFVDGAVVTARGTAFDIDRHEDGEIAVAVTNHAVRLDPKAGAPVDLPAGKQAVIDAAGRIGKISDADPVVVAAWRDGMLIAENSTLGSIVAALGAYHRGWIIISQPDVARLKVNAVLDLKAPEATLETLAEGLPIRVTTISPFVILIERR